MPIITVPPGQSVQAAINRAVDGDIIEIQAGSVYRGAFILPAKVGNAGVTIRTAGADQNLPSGTRVSPGDVAKMGCFASAGANQSVFATARSANNWKLVGVEVRPFDATSVTSELIKLGDGSGAIQRTLADVPQNLTLDRCFIHGLPGVDLKRGVSLQSGATVIKECYISDCKGVGYDSQAICGWNGPGPYTITNAFLEGAGENVMFGGSDPTIPGLVPSNILIDRCTLSKPLSWYVKDASYGGIHYSVKNLFEIKNASNVTVSNCILENCWADGQAGWAFSLKAVQQNAGAAPWSACQDVEIKGCTVRHCGGGYNIAGQTNIVARVSIHDNTLEDINSVVWGGAGPFVQICNSDSVSFDNDVAHQNGNIVSAYGAHNTNFSFTRNTVAHNSYGVKGDAQGTGNGTLATYFPACVFTQNIIVGPAVWAASYPAGNTFVTVYPGPVVPPVGTQINPNDPLALDLVLAVACDETAGPAMHELVSGQVAAAGARPFTWQASPDLPAAWGRGSAGFNQTIQCVSVPTVGAYWKKAPVLGFSCAYIFKPTSGTASGVQRFLDTDTTAGHVLYLDRDHTGAKGGWLTTTCCDAAGAVTLLDFPYPPNAWLCVVRAVGPTGITIYGNWVRGGHTTTPQMNVLASHACNLEYTWLGGSTQLVLPKTQCLMGTSVGTIWTPNALLAQLNIWGERALTAAEAQDYHDHAKRMFLPVNP